MPSDAGVLFVLERSRKSDDVAYDIRVCERGLEHVGHATLRENAWTLTFTSEPPSWAQRFVENLMRTSLRAAYVEAGQWPRRMQRWRKKPDGA